MPTESQEAANAIAAVTLGELVRTLQSFKADVREDFHSLNQRIDALHFVDQGKYEADRETEAERLKSVADRVDRVEDSLRWMARTVAGVAVTTFIVGLYTVLTTTGAAA